ncbi:MAG: MCE family protein [Desulfomonile tiedjei]|nr:MCE family protein [Desulfomonile tiedjei]
MNRFTLEAKVGIFFLAALAIFGYVWVKVLDIGLKEGFILKTRLKSAEGLVQGAQVQIAGIKVGAVKDVLFDPETGKALAVLEINDAYKNTIPADSRVALRTKGLLGDKYVVIEPGKPNVRKLKAGEELTLVYEPTEPEKVFESLGVITQDLQALTREARKQMVDDKGSEKVGNILDNTDAATKDLKEILGRNKTKINQTVDNTDNLTKGLNEIVMRNRDKLNRTMDDMEKTGNKFSKVASDLDGITKDIREGRGTLGRLINDESLYRDAQGLVKDVRNLSNRIQYGPGVMGRLINDPEMYYEARRAIRNMNKTAEDVGEATPISTLAVILGAFLK